MFSGNKLFCCKQCIYLIRDRIRLICNCPSNSLVHTEMYITIERIHCPQRLYPANLLNPWLFISFLFKCWTIIIIIIVFLIPWKLSKYRVIESPAFFLSRVWMTRKCGKRDFFSPVLTLVLSTLVTKDKDKKETYFKKYCDKPDKMLSLVDPAAMLYKFYILF